MVTSSNYWLRRAPCGDENIDYINLLANFLVAIEAVVNMSSHTTERTLGLSCSLVVDEYSVSLKINPLPFSNNTSPSQRKAVGLSVSAFS